MTCTYCVYENTPPPKQHWRCNLVLEMFSIWFAGYVLSHPPSKNHSQRPEFLVEAPQQNNFFLEHHPSEKAWDESSSWSKMLEVQTTTCSSQESHCSFSFQAKATRCMLALNCWGFHIHLIISFPLCLQSSWAEHSPG